MGCEVLDGELIREKWDENEGKDFEKMKGGSF